MDWKSPPHLTYRRALSHSRNRLATTAVSNSRQHEGWSGRHGMERRLPKMRRAARARYGSYLRAGSTSGPPTQAVHRASSPLRIYDKDQVRFATGLKPHPGVTTIQRAPTGTRTRSPDS